MDLDEIERLTEQIYEAGRDPDGWSLVTKRLSRLFGDAAIAIDSRATLGPDIPLYASARFDESLRDLHFEEYRTPEENPGVAALLSAEVGAPFPIESFIDPRTYDRDPSIRAILHPQRIDKGLLVAMERRPDALSFMNVFRTHEQEGFDQQHIKALSFFSKQIARSLRLSREAARAALQQDVATFEARNGWTIGGTMLLDHRARVVDSDVGALAVIDLKSGLAIRHGVLVSTARGTGRDTETLHTFIKSRSRNERPFVIPAGDEIITIVEVLHVQVRIPVSSHQEFTAISLKRVDPRGPYRVLGLGSTYGLTDAEVRVLDTLCASRTLNDAASRLGIARETAKTHVAHIYQKTGCGSLAELMRLVGRFQ